MTDKVGAIAGEDGQGILAQIKVNQPHCVMVTTLRETVLRDYWRAIDEIDEHARWCEEHIGPGGRWLLDGNQIRYQPDWDWVQVGVIYYFREADPAFHFKVRWG